MATGFQFDAQGAWIAKDPSATKDYSIDFTNWLAAADTLVTVVWTVPAGIVKVSDGKTTKTCYIELSGGSLGKAYVINAHITTANGLQDEQEFRVAIRENI